MENIILKDFKNENFRYVKEFSTKGNIVLFAIYKNPKDFPDKYVIRLWQINKNVGKPVATRYCVIKDNLEECRASIPEGFYKFDRIKNDDPAIVETWI